MVCINFACGVIKWAFLTVEFICVCVHLSNLDWGWHRSNILLFNISYRLKRSFRHHGMPKESGGGPVVLSGIPHPVWLQKSVHHGDGLRHQRQRQRWRHLVHRGDKTLNVAYSRYTNGWQLFGAKHQIEIKHCVISSLNVAKLTI